MKPSKLLAVLFVLVLIATACGGGDDNGSTANPDSDQTSGNEETSDGGSDEGDGGEDGGDSAPSASGTAFPEGIDEDFLVPVPAGWEIDIYEELAEQGVTLSGGVQVLYPNDDFDRIIAFYDEWTEQDTVDHVRSEVADTIVYSRMEAPISQITVQRNYEERDGTWTFLVITVLEDPN